VRHSESVTFGGGGLDRAAHLRSDRDRLAQMLSDETATALVTWRGKLLFGSGDQPKLACLPISDMFFKHAEAEPVFLGLVKSAPVFAYDVSRWEPEQLPESEGGLFDSQQIRDPALPDNHWLGDLRQVMARLSPLDAELAASAKAIIGWHGSHGFCAKCGAASGVSMGGWQRHCELCNSHHFPRTDPVVIMLITNGNNVLLGRSPGWPEPMFSLLAGFVEPGETLEAAVRREVAEEVGVKVGAVGYLASQPWPFPASLMVGCRGEALSTDLNPDPVEIAEAFWISREQIMAVFAGEDETILPARRGSVAHFLLENWLADRLD